MNIEARRAEHRFFQVLLIVSIIALSWLSFMIVHELGHVVAAWLTGGSVSRVVLHPLKVSWTLLDRNPHPEMVAWGGPVIGALAPLSVLGVARMFRLPEDYLLRFFAGFCLVANGMYLMIDSFMRGGDGGTLVLNGAAPWQLLLFGGLTVPAGFWLWHGLGRWFGLGVPGGRVSRRAAICSASLLAAVVVAELAF